jgi:hypothetical protein
LPLQLGAVQISTSQGLKQGWMNCLCKTIHGLFIGLPAWAWAW